MNAREFVDAIREYAVSGTVSDTVSVLRDPPGRQPDPGLLALAAWYARLDDHGQHSARALMAIVARDAVHAMMCVIDGVGNVDPARVPGDHFELRHVHAGSVEILSGPNAPLLHELL